MKTVWDNIYLNARSQDVRQFTGVRRGRGGAKRGESQLILLEGFEEEEKTDEKEEETDAGQDM